MLQKTTSRIAFVAALLALGSALAEPAFAQRGRGGGGMRAGGMRAGGGGFGAGGFSGARGGGLRASGATSINRSSFNRPAGGYDRGQMAANRPAGGYAANQPAGGQINRGQVNRSDVNRDSVRGGNRVNTGNVVAGNNVNIENNGGWGGWNDYPVGAGLAVGTAAAVTAAAIGSTYYSLPPSCAPYPYGGYSYYQCGGVYYEPRYEGDTVVYVTVPQPGG